MSESNISNKEVQYWRLKIIGQGAYGKVYQVQNKSSKDLYAMKKIDLT